MFRLTTVFVLSSLFISPTPATRREAPARGQTSTSVTCQPVGPLARNPDLPEGSGVAASRRHRGIFWAHNDSGDPVLLKLDGNGGTIGRVRVTGAAVEDWEDIAVGPCGQDSCLYIGDIGDNDGERAHITVYRVPEPSMDATETPPAHALKAAYPDGRHDAESLVVTTDGGVFIVTKGDPGPVALYRVPRGDQSGEIVRLERVGEPLASGDIRPDSRPSAADASPGGEWVVIRTTAYAAFYRATDLTAGRWREMSRIELGNLNEPRGEGITFGSADVIVLVGEGGGGSRPGTFAKLRCTFERAGPGRP